MGLSSSKSPLERRNTVLKRSQRRAIHSLKVRVEKLHQDINKFRGTEDDEKYTVFIAEIKQLSQELNKKVRDLQPQVKSIHQATVARLDEAALALQKKLRENREKAHKNKESPPNQAQEDAKLEDQRDSEEIHESNVLEQSTNKRRTVELKFVQVIPDVSTQAEVRVEETSPPAKVMSPADKRKSILKMGVAVMPGAMLQEISKKTTNRASENVNSKANEEGSDAMLDRLGETVENLQQIEYQIADFIGRKHGTQYNRIKDKLDNTLQEISQMKTNDEFVVDQIQLCTNYVKSCLRFLDDKALENDKEVEDDVFTPEKNSIDNGDVQNKLQKLMKTTAI